ncbi:MULTISPECIES: 7TM diverse intracellular signaling domain-containing protein [unclassified Acidovorax]|uniref:sensor histidine kinase n=1 Tax=unclassified Acidovorax TaxID=2684926 RepID=UPI001C477533|nr:MULTISPECIES: 7TM diverse intracellular signaling domain-containing protein [unclassified Acidovorax]MBV7430214.1 histidine kinase [Acidovorax sp. sif0732]MBV7451607.1 histidine kinase [Acidovorax sp. sif0715]
MPPTGKAFWRTGRWCAALLLAAWLAACGGGSATDNPTHLRQAAFRMEPGAGWEPPPAPPFAGEEEKGAWASVPLPHARERSLAEGGASLRAPPDVAWYRLDLPPPGTPGAPSASGAPGQDLFLYLPRWQTIGIVAIYVDGRMAYRTRGSRVWNSFNRPLWVALGNQAAGGEPPRTVWLRMASQRGVGGAVSSAWVGTEQNLLWRYSVRRFVQNDFISLTGAAFLAIGLFALAVGCVRRREPIYLLFFAISVTTLLRSLHYVVDDRPLPVPDDWFGWMTVNSLGWAMVCTFAFAFRVHGRRMPALALGIAGLVSLGTVLTLPLPPLLPYLDAMLPLVYLVITVLTAVVAASGLWASWRARSREGLVLFAWFSLNVPAGAHDLLMVNYRIDMEHVYLAPYNAIGLFAIFLAIVWRRYVGAIHAVEVANAGLESQLAARERELTASHEQLRALERQQTLATERQRMMQDMHDGIGSSLMSALRMVERGQASTADTAQVLKDCIDDLKLAIDSLDPADADLLALLAAVRFRLAPRLKAAGITLAWNVQDLPPLPWLDPQSALHVLRILQEVLANILKHTQATLIDVATAPQAQAGQGGAGVVVRIRDNAGAFVLSEGPPAALAGQGLLNVRHRAQALGGRCQWAAWEGGGEFTLWLPLARGD